MAGKDIDRVRARSALEVVKQHPLMVLFGISPVIAGAVGGSRPTRDISP
jgi:hypothetical protein